MYVWVWECEIVHKAEVFVKELKFHSSNKGKQKHEVEKNKERRKDKIKSGMSTQGFSSTNEMFNSIITATLGQNVRFPWSFVQD